MGGFACDLANDGVAMNTVAISAPANRNEPRCVEHWTISRLTADIIECFLKARSQHERILPFFAQFCENVLRRAGNELFVGEFAVEASDFFAGLLEVFF